MRCRDVLKSQQCCKEALSRGTYGVTSESVSSDADTPDHKVLLGEASVEDLELTASYLRSNGWDAGVSWLVAKAFGL